MDYFNRDLVYSTWYDQIDSELTGDANKNAQSLEENLMLDMNDNAVIYSKLREKLQEKDTSKVESQNRGFDINDIATGIGLNDIKMIQAIKKFSEDPKKVIKFLTRKQKEFRIINA